MTCSILTELALLGERSEGMLMIYASLPSGRAPVWYSIDINLVMVLHCVVLSELHQKVCQTQCQTAHQVVSVEAADHRAVFGHDQSLVTGFRLTPQEVRGQKTTGAPASRLATAKRGLVP